MSLKLTCEAAFIVNIIIFATAFAVTWKDCGELIRYFTSGIVVGKLVLKDHNPKCLYTRLAVCTATRVMGSLSYYRPGSKWGIRSTGMILPPSHPALPFPSPPLSTPALPPLIRSRPESS